VWFVPAYRAAWGKLDAEGNVGVTKEQLKEFFDKVK
jgi:hypothetical protein